MISPPLFRHQEQALVTGFLYTRIKVVFNPLFLLRTMQGDSLLTLLDNGELGITSCLIERKWLPAGGMTWHIRVEGQALRVHYAQSN